MSKTKINEIENIRYSHAPLFTEKICGEKFLENIEDKKDEKGKVIENLTITEIREKCFQALGYLEEFQRVKGKGFAEKVNEREAISKMESENDLLEFLLSNNKPVLKEIINLQMENVDSEKEIIELVLENIVNPEREYIVKQIRELFSYKQVRNFFLENLKSESEKYQNARPKMRIVASMEFAQDGAFRKMIEIYLASKHTHGKLVETAAQNVAKLEAMRKKAQEKEEAERGSANQEEQGFLKAQQLLQYKQQIKEKGFALTPSRKALTERISEHVLAGRKVFLVGSTGTGKTELAFYVADVISGKYEIVSWHEGTTTRDLFGYRELWTNEEGQTVSGTKPGPVTKAVEDGAVVIHDEYTAGSTRSMLAAKAFMNAKAGQKIKIPGFNGDVFEVSENFGEIFTGNPKDEKTKAREDMDPAILRMLTGLKIDYMPAEEMKDIILANLIEDNGVLRLSPAEVELIEKLSKAAELMHLFHNREFSQIESFLGTSSSEFATLKSIFGDIQDAKLDKNFLDPGTLFSLFSDFDFTRAKSGDLKKHLEKKLFEFLQDPKFDTVPEERKLAGQILKITGVIQDPDASSIEVKITKKIEEKDYILPSELAGVADKKLNKKNPFDIDEKNNNLPSGAPNLLRLLPQIKKLREIGGENFIEPEQVFETLAQLPSKDNSGNIITGAFAVPLDEQKRLLKEFEAELKSGTHFDEFVAGLKIIQSCTEENAPLITKLPCTLTWQSAYDMMIKVQKADNSYKYKLIYNSDFILSDIKIKVWNSGLRGWSSACLQDSKNKHYDENKNNQLSQLNHQIQKLLKAEGKSDIEIKQIINSPLDSSERKVFVKKYGIQEDMLLAMLLLHLSSKKKELLIQTGYMRLNARGAGSAPLNVYSNDGDLYLRGSHCDAHSDSGLGASLGISS